ncbi:MAG: response regulator transcription factor [Flavobacteriia bacterium]|nr:response regulator transcription factor [Flavobacteriia bacterium]
MYNGRYYIYQMIKTILKYGAIMGLLMLAYAILESLWLGSMDWTSLALFGIALLFTAFGIWAGLRFNRPKNELLSIAKPAASPEEYDLRPREMEILQLMSTGLSNQEIADALHISLSTVKTHNMNLFAKLDVKRRTQAVSKAQELGLIA